MFKKSKRKISERFGLDLKHKVDAKLAAIVHHHNPRTTRPQNHN